MHFLYKIIQKPVKLSNVFIYAVLFVLPGLVVAKLFVAEHPLTMAAPYPGEHLLGETWGIASFDQAQDERLIVNTLKAGGFGTFHSETNQFFYIDDFSGLKEAPLDKLEFFLEPIDPRNDGYALKLRSFFVRDGKRFFYIQLSGANGASKLIKTLENFDCDLELLGNERNFTSNFILGGTALIAAFILSRNKRRFILQMPLLFAYAWTGPLGLALAGILTGLRSLLPDLWAEFYPWQKDTGYGSLKERVKPYRLHFLGILIFLLLYGFICIMGNLPLFAVSLGLLFFILLEYFGIRTKEKNTERRRFTAVWMMPKKAKIPEFKLPLIPYIAASLFMLVASLIFPGMSSNSGELSFSMEDYIKPADYENHLNFQLSFSGTPLGVTGANNYIFSIADDGLINAVPDNRPALSGGIPDTLPGFPLEKLRGFLVEYGKGKRAVSIIHIELMSALLLLAMCFLGKIPV